MKLPALNGGRILIIDAIRGLAIALMILDHSLFAIESIGMANNIVEYSRLSITRFSMPLSIRVLARIVGWLSTG